MFDWNRILLIARREINMRFGQKTYKTATIVQILIVALLALSPALFARFGPDDSDDDTSGQTVALVDHADTQLADQLPQVLGLIAGDDTPMQVTVADSDDAARAMVDDHDADVALIVTRDDAGALAFDLVTPSGDTSSTAAQTVIAAATSFASAERIQESGLSPSQIQTVFGQADVQVTRVDTESSGLTFDSGIEIAAYVISYVATFMLFMAIVLYGQWIAQGVVEEKSSRIMEIMVNAATPRDLLVGKIVGIMTAALVQFVPMLLTGALLLSQQARIARLIGAPEDRIVDLNFTALATRGALWFLVYFVLGFLLYGAAYAGVGSLLSRQEEVGTAVAPMTTLMAVGYFAAFYTMSNPDSTIARIAFLFPATSPFTAMPRILLGDPSMGEIILSVALLAAAVLAAMWLAGRLYRIGVLMYGQRPSWASLFRSRGGLQTVAR